MTNSVRTTLLALAASLPLFAVGCGSASEPSPPAAEGKDAAASTTPPLATSTSLPEGNPHPGYCPVMGGKVDKKKGNASAALHSDYKGKRYYFCCEGCKLKFDADPEKWIASPAKPGGAEAE